MNELKKNCKSNTGRIAYNNVLAAAAGAGEHTCSPEDPCQPGERCRPAEPKGGVMLADRAASLGVREKTLREAHGRMHHTDHSLAQPQAIEEGRYCWAAQDLGSHSLWFSRCGFALSLLQ